MKLSMFVLQLVAHYHLDHVHFNPHFLLPKEFSSIHNNIYAIKVVRIKHPYPSKEVLR